MWPRHLFVDCWPCTVLSSPFQLAPVIAHLQRVHQAEKRRTYGVPAQGGHASPERGDYAAERHHRGSRKSSQLLSAATVRRRRPAAHFGRQWRLLYRTRTRAHAVPATAVRIRRRAFGSQRRRRRESAGMEHDTWSRPYSTCEACPPFCLIRTAVVFIGQGSSLGVWKRSPVRYTQFATYTLCGAILCIYPLSLPSARRT